MKSARGPVWFDRENTEMKAGILISAEETERDTEAMRQGAHPAKVPFVQPALVVNYSLPRESFSEFGARTEYDLLCGDDRYQLVLSGQYGKPVNRMRLEDASAAAFDGLTYCCSVASEDEAKTRAEAVIRLFRSFKAVTS